LKYLQSPNFTPWQKKENLLIVIHWTAGAIESAINWFVNPDSKVSAHYLIDRFGEVVQMVSEDSVAWHAGESAWKDYPTFGIWNSLNPCSIGIELEGPPSMIGLGHWMDAQIVGLIKLCQSIQSRNPLVKLIDHSSIDVAKKKVDVKKGWGWGDRFPWARLIRESGIKEA
jgi:N-acetylmuramoyl-L-alanine amidase